MSSVPTAYRDIMNDPPGDAVEPARDCLDNERRRIGRVAGAISAAGFAGDGGGEAIDDEHNEGSERFTLTLSNPSSGNLTDSSATGTITNHDAERRESPIFHRQEQAGGTDQRVLGRATVQW